MCIQVPKISIMTLLDPRLLQYKPTNYSTQSDTYLG